VVNECVNHRTIGIVPGFIGDDCPSLILAFVSKYGNRRGKEQQQVVDTPSTVVVGIHTLGCRREREPYRFALGERLSLRLKEWAVGKTIEHTGRRIQTELIVAMVTNTALSRVVETYDSSSARKQHVRHTAPRFIPT
jgi:hypothetical protein